MNYLQLSKEIESLGYRDKLKLAQLLIQLARKEEEAQSPAGRTVASFEGPQGQDLVEYAAERLAKLRPGKRAALMNSLDAMFQFQGGIGSTDKERLIADLQKAGHLSIDVAGRVQYQA